MSDIDFENNVSEFYKCLHEFTSKNNDLDSEKNDQDKKENICLISNEPLTEFFITLPCNHKFNYIPLLKASIENIKQVRIVDNKPYLKCPYCKTIHKKCLPYNPILEKKRFYKINSHKTECMTNKKCTYIYKGGKNKGLMCNNKAYYEYCSQHLVQLKTKKNALEDIDLKNISTTKLTTFTVLELKKLAKINKKKNYSRLKKKELITLLKSN